MSKQRTISLEMFAPDGSKVVISEVVSSPQDLTGLLEWTRDAGLSAAAPAFPEEYEQGWVTDVALMKKRNEDGSETPHVAFYQKQLESRWLAVYLNSDADKAEFETRTGLKLADLPECDGDSHPTRSSKSAARLIVALPYPLKIERKTKIWGEGDTDKRHYLNRYMSGKPAEFPKRVLNWWEDELQLKKLNDWLDGAKKAKPEFYGKALSLIRPMAEFDSSAIYVEALKQIAANEEEKAKSDEIPF